MTDESLSSKARRFAAERRIGYAEHWNLLNELAEEIERQGSKLNESQKLIDSLQQRVHLCAGYDELQSGLAEAIKQRDNLSAELSAGRAAWDGYRVKLADADATIAYMKAGMDELEDEIAEKSLHLNNLRKNYDLGQAALAQAESDGQMFQRECEGLTKDYEKARKQTSAALQDLDTERQRVKTLEEELAAARSQEVCYAPHENVGECGYCQRDRLALRLDKIRDWCADSDETSTWFSGLATLLDLDAISVHGKFSDPAEAAKHGIVVEGRAQCQHQWVDPTNPIVEANGFELCVKCGLLELPESHAPAVEGRFTCLDCDAPIPEPGYCAPCIEKMCELIDPPAVKDRGPHANTCASLMGIDCDCSLSFEQKSVVEIPLPKCAICARPILADQLSGRDKNGQHTHTSCWAQRDVQP